MVASAAVVKFGPLRFMQRLQIMLNHFDSGRSRDQTCKWGIAGYLCTKPRSPATALKTKEYIGVIDLYGGCDWERFSMLPE
jgi:hypothetical protein